MLGLVEPVVAAHSAKRSSQSHVAPLPLKLQLQLKVLKVLKPSLSSGSLLANTLEFRDDAGNEIAFFEKKKKTKCAQSVAMVRRFSFFVTTPACC